jgi:hypothetical protein
MQGDSDPFEDVLRNKDRNSGRDYWYWKDKPQGEAGAALEALTGAGFAVKELRSRDIDPQIAKLSWTISFVGLRLPS